MVSIKYFHTHNSSLEGAMEIQFCAILFLLRCSFRWYRFWPKLKTFLPLLQVHEYGIMTDLPVHHSSPSEVAALVAAMTSWLAALSCPPPALVTIARWGRCVSRDLD